MAARKKKSDLAVVTKLANKKQSTQAAFDAAFVKVETPAEVAPIAEPDLPELGGADGGEVVPLVETFNARTGELAPATPEQTEMVLASLTPKERKIVRKDVGDLPTQPPNLGATPGTPAFPAAAEQPKPGSKFAAFDHVQANVKGGIDVKLAPCTAIVGPNRSHKTAVLDSIKLAILGTHPGVADRPTDLLAFASTGASNLTATISGPNGALTTMLADAPGFKRPVHEATGDLNDLLAKVDAKQIMPIVAIGELLTFGETRMREAVFARFGQGTEVKVPDGLADDQHDLWLAAEGLLRSGSEGGVGVEPTYGLLAEKFRQLKLEAGKQLKRSEESASLARAELGDAVLVPKDQTEKLHVELERLTKWSTTLEQAARLNREYRADKAAFVKAFEALPPIPEHEGAEPTFGVAANAVDLMPLRTALDAARALAEQDASLLGGLKQIAVAAEKSNTCPCCRSAGPEVAAQIRKTCAAVTARFESRQGAVSMASNVFNAAVHQNAQGVRSAQESAEHIAWRGKRDHRLATEQARAALTKDKEVLLARKAALPPEPPTKAQEDADKLIVEIRDTLKKITVQAGQVAVLESHETEARKARNHNGVFKVLEVEAKNALQRTLERVRTAAQACVNRYVPAGWEVRLTLDDGACRWEIVGADGAPHGKGVASGSEMTTLTIALACAWTEGSPLRVLLVDDDDLGKLSPENLRAFLDRLREVVEGGRLTQVVVAWTRAEEIPAGWTKVARTA